MSKPTTLNADVERQCNVVVVAGYPEAAELMRELLDGIHQWTVKHDEVATQLAAVQAERDRLQIELANSHDALSAANACSDLPDDVQAQVDAALLDCTNPACHTLDMLGKRLAAVRALPVYYERFNNGRGGMFASDTVADATAGGWVKVEDLAACLDGQEG